MKLTLIPQLGTPNQPEMTIHVAGDVLTIDGTPHDLSDIPEGATVSTDAVDCNWIAGPISRTDGVLHLTLLLPHGFIPDPAPSTALSAPGPKRRRPVSDHDGGGRLYVGRQYRPDANQLLIGEKTT